MSGISDWGWGKGGTGSGGGTAGVAAADGRGEVGSEEVSGIGALTHLALGAGDAGSPRSCFKPLKSPGAGRSCSTVVSGVAAGRTGGTGGTTETAEQTMFSGSLATVRGGGSGGGVDGTKQLSLLSTPACC